MLEQLQKPVYIFIIDRNKDFGDKMRMNFSIVKDCRAGLALALWIVHTKYIETIGASKDINISLKFLLYIAKS